MDHHEKKFKCINPYCKHNGSPTDNECHKDYVDHHFRVLDKRGTMRCMNFENKKDTIK